MAQIFEALKNLQGTVDETRPQQVVDAQRAAGGGARRVARGVGEELPELGVLEYAAVAVVGDSYLVCLFDVGGTRVVAADPGRQSRPCVGSDRQRGPVQGPERLVFPVHVPAPVRAEEGVGYSELEHGELGARLQVEGFPDVHLEARIVPRDALPGVHVYGAAHLSFTTAPEASTRRLVGGRAVAYLPHPLRVGPPGVHDPLRARAAVDVVALTVAQWTAPEELADRLGQEVPHFRSQSVPPSACRTSRRGASGSG